MIEVFNSPLGAYFARRLNIIILFNDNILYFRRQVYMFLIRSCDSRCVCLQMSKDNDTVDVIQVKVLSDDYFLK